MARYPSDKTTRTRHQFDPAASKDAVSKTVTLSDALGQGAGGLDGVYVSCVFTGAAGGAPQSFVHNLGRVPVGFVVVGVKKGTTGGSTFTTSPVICYGTTTLNSETVIRLQCLSGGTNNTAANVPIAKILVF